MKKVIIFIDALPFDYVLKSETVKDLLKDFKKPITVAINIWLFFVENCQKTADILETIA